MGEEFFEIKRNNSDTVIAKFNETCQKIDAKNFESIQNEAITFLADEDKAISEFVFDLDNVIYVSSAGLRMFSAINKIAQQADIEYKLINLRKDILKMFQLTGYASIFKIEEKAQF